MSTTTTTRIADENNDNDDIKGKHRDVRFDAEPVLEQSIPTKKNRTNPHGLSLLDTRLSDRPADYEPPTSLRGPPPPDLLFGSSNTYDMDSEAGPSSLGLPPSSDKAKQRRISLTEFRRSEGPSIRSAKLQALWTSLPDRLPAPSRGPTPTSLMHLPGQGSIGILSPERVERLRRLYEEELSRRISLEERDTARLWGGADDLPEPTTSVTATPTNHANFQVNSPVNADGKVIKWKDFRKFLWDQEEQLWDIFCDLDKDGDGRLDHKELKGALNRSGRSMRVYTSRPLLTPEFDACVRHLHDRLDVIRLCPVSFLLLASFSTGMSAKRLATDGKGDEEDATGTNVHHLCRV